MYALTGRGFEDSEDVKLTTGSTGKEQKILRLHVFPVLPVVKKSQALRPGSLES